MMIKNIKLEFCVTFWNYIEKQNFILYHNIYLIYGQYILYYIKLKPIPKKKKKKIYYI